MTSRELAATPTREHLSSLQVVRGLAAAMVVLYHTGTVYAIHTHELLWNNVFRWGMTGVDIFFVLSGLVIYWVHNQDFGEPRRARRFIVRRAFRLLPVYWVIVILKTIRDGGEQGLLAVLSALMLIPWPQPFIPVAWTLTYEALFYLAFLAMILLPRGRWTLLPLIILASLPWLPRVSADIPGAGAIRFLTQDLLSEFVMGVGVGWVLKHRLPSARQAAVCAVVGGGAFVLSAGAGTLMSLQSWRAGGLSAYEAAELHSNVVFTNGTWTFGIPASLAILGLVALETHDKLRIPLRGALQWLGDISYSTYLLHGFVLSAFIAFAARKNMIPAHPWMVVAPWLITLAAAWVFYRLIERPGIRLGARLSREAEPPAVIKEVSSSRRTRRAVS